MEHEKHWRTQCGGVLTLFMVPQCACKYVLWLFRLYALQDGLQWWLSLIRQLMLRTTKPRKRLRFCMRTCKYVYLKPQRGRFPNSCQTQWFWNSWAALPEKIQQLLNELCTDSITGAFDHHIKVSPTQINEEQSPSWLLPMLVLVLWAYQSVRHLQTQTNTISVLLLGMQAWGASLASQDDAQPRVHRKGSHLLWCSQHGSPLPPSSSLKMVSD